MCRRSVKRYLTSYLPEVFGVRLLTPCGFREREVVPRTTMPEVRVVFYKG